MLFDTLAPKGPPSHARLCIGLLVWIVIGGFAFYRQPGSAAGELGRVFSISLDAVMVVLSLWAIYRRWRVERARRTTA